MIAPSLKQSRKIWRSQIKKENNLIQRGTLFELLGIEVAEGYAYFAWALAFSGLLYSNMIFFGSHLSGDSKEHIAFWMAGLYEKDWAKHYYTIFKMVFGDKHFSLRCLLSSGIASILIVYMVYFLLNDILGVLGSRTAEPIDLFDTIVLGAILNIVPDYLSLLKSRLIIIRLGRTPRLALQIGLLFTDFAISAVIGVLSILLYIAVTGGQAIAPLEIAALFSEYSIFFYSTFATSIWSLLYFLSVFIMRIFSRTPLYLILASEEKPVQTISLMCSALFLCFWVAAKPVVETRSDGTSTLDTFLCNLDPSICHNVVRISSDEKIALKHLKNACRDLKADRCKRAARSYAGGDTTNVFKLWRLACETDDPVACNNVAFLVDNGEVHFDKAVDIVGTYQSSCAAGYAVACTNYGIKRFLGANSPDSRDDALKAFRRGCQLQDGQACSNAATMSWEAANMPAALGFAQSACDWNVKEGCFTLGLVSSEMTPNSVMLNPTDVAARAFGKACALKHGDSCFHAINYLSSGSKSAETAGAVLDAFGSACNTGACSAAALSDAKSNASPSADDTAKWLLKRGCKNNSVNACLMLGHAYEQGTNAVQNIAKALEYFGYACDLDINFGCPELERIQAAYPIQ